MAYSSTFGDFGCSQNLQVTSPDDTDLNLTNLPHQQALVNLMQRTGYNMIQQNGQRHYGGPPPGWKGPTPGKGNLVLFIGIEIFVVPNVCTTESLIDG